MEMELVFPYRISMGILVEFCYLWNTTLICGGTRKIKSIISMPSHHFKRIFGVSPEKKEYPVPRGMEKFISKVVVKGTKKR